MPESKIISEVELNVVGRPGELDVGWFERLFSMQGWPGEIQSVSHKLVGTGQSATSVRCQLELENAPASVPSSLVAKIQDQSSAEALEGSENRQGMYEREVNFYKEFAGELSEVTARPFYAGYEPATDRLTVVMEDLSPAEQGDQFRSASLDLSKQAVSAAAKLHALRWNDDTLRTKDWLMGMYDGCTSSLNGEIVGQLWAAFAARYAEWISDDDRGFVDAFVGKFDAWINGYRGPLCLFHGDFRLDNLLIATQPHQRPVTVVDWQTVGVSGGVIDVAYFIGSSLSRADRREHEATLLEWYRQALQREGVEYSKEQIWHDYRWFAFWGLVIVLGTVMVTRTDRGDQIFELMYRRFMDQIRDVDSVELL